MSHVATVAIKIKNLQALRAACDSLGLELREGQKTYRWFGVFMNDYQGEDAAFNAGLDPKDYGKCEHAIAVRGNPGAYEVGLIRNKDDNSYSLAWDFWNGGNGLEAAVGRSCSKLVTAYTTEVAKRSLAFQGLTLENTRKLDDGSVELVFAKL